jgi:hypothetical protein
MGRIAALLPPRQRGVYASEVLASSEATPLEEAIELRT